MLVAKAVVSDVKINGKGLDLSGQYHFSIPSFNAAGGDGYPNITAHPGFVNTGFVDAEVLKEYLESHSPLKVEEYQPAGEMVYQN